MLKQLFIAGFSLVLCSGIRAETIVAGVTFKASSRWEAVVAASPMRAAQWRIAPLRKETDAGDVVMFYFGQGQGGDTASNIQRWKRVVTDEQGGRVEGEVKERKVDGLKITELVTYGTYASGMPMPGATNVPKPNYGLVGVVIEGPQGNIFVRMTGPSVLVKANLATFRQFIDSAKVVK